MQLQSPRILSMQVAELLTNPIFNKLAINNPVFKFIHRNMSSMILLEFLENLSKIYIFVSGIDLFNPFLASWINGSGISCCEDTTCGFLTKK